MLTKIDLKNAIADKNRGILATEEDRLAIQSVIAQIEDRNPTPKPLEATELLNGDWRLLYTTSDELLGINRVPLWQLGQIYQCVRSSENRIYNIAEVNGVPLLEGLVCVSAQFTPVSTQRVEVQFKRGVFGLQRAMGYQSPKQFIQRLQTTPKLPRLQAFDFDINRDRSGWLEITYLDEDLRIGRGNQGSLFVLTKC